MIYLIITCSIQTKYDPVNESHRKNLYLSSIQQTLKLLEGTAIKPILVENNGLRSTYLDTLGCDVVYTNNNQVTYKQKAVNELLDIKEVIEKYKMLDTDTIIKLTGRYMPLDTHFFELVQGSECEAFVKFFNVCTRQFMHDDCVLGFFAIKVKYMKQFSYECKVSPEVEFARFVRTIPNIKEVNSLSLRCCFANNLKILDV